MVMNSFGVKLRGQVLNLDVSVGFARSNRSQRFAVRLEMEMAQYADQKNRVATRAGSE